MTLVRDRADMPERSDDTPSAVQKVHELEQIADVGEDERTPWILLGRVWVKVATAVLVVLAIALFAYRLAA